MIPNIPQMHIILKYCLNMLFKKGDLDSVLCKCFKVFGFVVDNNIFPLISPFDEICHIQSNQAKTLGSEIRIPAQDWYYIQAYLALDPIRLFQEHILKTDYNPPPFWDILLNNINNTAHLSIIKYLLIKDYIINTYNTCNILEHIIMKYFDLEYARIHTILFN